MYNSNMLRQPTYILQRENKLILYYSASSYPYFLSYSWAIRINFKKLKKSEMAETSLHLPSSKNSAISVKFPNLNRQN